MALFPFSISDIDDPERIRVVLYASGRMGHAPLNALLNQMRQDIERLDKKQSKETTQLTKRMDALEQQLKRILQNPENAKHKQDSQNGQSGKEGDKFITAGSDIRLQSHASDRIISGGISLHSDLSTGIASGNTGFGVSDLLIFPTFEEKKT
ncbi:hypothetical protein [Bartonella heixiaziensis]|uniref:hypothetical protein n=1 Tax=Bartonella heixiaziensis TaxID=1461000 RepID=UPI003D1D718D